jgi:hypothetical protein
MRSREARNPGCAGVLPTVLVGTKFLAGMEGGSPEHVSKIVKGEGRMTRKPSNTLAVVQKDASVQSCAMEEQQRRAVSYFRFREIQVDEGHGRPLFATTNTYLAYGVACEFRLSTVPQHRVQFKKT